MLKIYNTMTKEKEVFKPLASGKVGIYVCGMTVYDLCHIGHGRVFVCFDVITRYLKTIGYKVNYVRNITDIDDKIIKRSQENGEAFDALTQRMIQHMHEDFKSLNILAPTHEPRATEYTSQMISLIETLIDKGFAYVAENGDVCYRVREFKGYGKLSGKNIDDLIAGSRVEASDKKENPLDFVLWKKAKPGEPSWESPWGAGRPGWHIECSAMSKALLGEHFDIHGGGFDLQFPHHENEIAQSEAASCEHTFAHSWMHVGFLEINKEKMSKSLNNFFTIREVVQMYSPDVIRYFLLSSHYRSPINFSKEALANAKQALERFYLAMRHIEVPKGAETDASIEKAFHAAMEDDFNTPNALAVLFDAARELNRIRESDEAKAAILTATLKKLGRILGILELDPEAFLQSGDDINLDDINLKIADRQQARQDKDWTLADQIRDELLTKGIVLEDGAHGTTWRRV